MMIHFVNETNCEVCNFQKVCYLQPIQFDDCDCGISCTPSCSFKGRYLPCLSTLPTNKCLRRHVRGIEPCHTKNHKKVIFISHTTLHPYPIHLDSLERRPMMSSPLILNGQSHVYIQLWAWKSCQSRQKNYAL